MQLKLNRKHKEDTSLDNNDGYKFAERACELLDGVDFKDEHEMIKAIEQVSHGLKTSTPEKIRKEIL